MRAAPPPNTITGLIAVVQTQLSDDNVATVATTLTAVSDEQLISLLERLSLKHRAVAFRLLPKARAKDVFELLDPGVQHDLVKGLQDADVAELFGHLDPDDRVWLLEELPSVLASQLLQGLTEQERKLTADVLGYPKGSVGRRMTPEFVTTSVNSTVEESLQLVRQQLDTAETVYVIPVLGIFSELVGVVSLRDLLRAEASTEIQAIMRTPVSALVYEDEERAARLCADSRLIALPVVDSDNRLVGMLTIDDAVRILEYEESEDSARQGGVEPLRRPYFSTPVHSLVSSRVVWLLVLAIGATLTVQVLSVFEDTLEQVTVLALFVPLLIGTGGNTGNQAATTITRALALGDVRPQDVLRVLLRELGVGLALGLLLGVAGGVITGLVYEPNIGLVIGLTLVAVCAMAATFGGVMPIIARAIRVDPAVFSNPFITTFVDASGLIIYFLIARAVLQI